jgi:hypothetical protein
MAIGLSGVSATASVGSISPTEISIGLSLDALTASVGVPGIIHYQDVDTGSNTSYTDVATGSNTSYTDVTGKVA